MQGPNRLIQVSNWILTRRRDFIWAFILLLLIGLSLGGVKLYASYYDRNAWTLLEENGLSSPEEVIQKYPRSTAALTARFSLGEKALEKKSWDEAIQIYQPMTELPDRQAIFRIAALQNLAFASRGKGDWENAFRYLERAQKDSSNPVPDYSRLLTARLLEEKGEKEKAEQIYQELPASIWFKKPKEEKKRAKK